MSPERFAKASAVLDNRQPDLTVFMEGVHKPHNLAAVARSGDAVGVGKVHAVFTGNKRSMGKVNAGSGVNRYVAVQAHETVQAAAANLRARGMQLVVAHLDETAADYRQVNYTKPTAIMVGNELEGVSPEAIELADHAVYVPMVGMVQSLNVSVAAALLLFEAKTQRERAGMYGQCKISPERRAELLFRWLHPQVAIYCDRFKLPFPSIDEQGYIAEVLEDRLEGSRISLSDFNKKIGLAD